MTYFTYQLGAATCCPPTEGLISGRSEPISVTHRQSPASFNQSQRGLSSLFHYDAITDVTVHLFTQLCDGDGDGGDGGGGGGGGDDGGGDVGDGGGVGVGGGCGSGSESLAVLTC